ncbi:MAG: 4-(cytidine 5'-diphospho)-2-C-methyl-D-erythritol kinase [Treponema sp.]|nr:4-(cytidine 5'-diphospho)-2-C-methyl-D-erythritol kinase [Treponema sp.]
MPELPGKLSIFSPAKVNLHLKVKNKRSDGFHDLESVFLAVNFGDNLDFQPIDTKNAIEIKCSSGESAKTQSFNKLNIENNIIYKAVSFFREKTNFSQGLKIKLEKYIPVGGGLGGGSSNAAVTLLTLNKMAGYPLNREALLEAAATLGSDVPFFIYETPAAFVTGRGEIIEPIEAPDLHIVLVNPGFSSSTATAFKLLDEYRSGRFHTEAQRHGAIISNLFSVSSVSPCLRVMDFCNDFLKVFPEKEKSIYNNIISQLIENGAQYANLSGAGSTCFGVFENKQQAQKAADFMQNKWGFVQLCRKIDLV